MPSDGGVRRLALKRQAERFLTRRAKASGCVLLAIVQPR
jgi:hypothetical protein